MKLASKKKLIGCAFIAPWMVGFLLFFLVPVLQTLVFSLNTVNVAPDGYKLVFEGFDNFIYAFRSDAEYPVALVSSLFQLLSDVPFILTFSFFVAVVLNKSFKGNHIVKLIFFFTVILSTGVFQQFQSTAASVQTAQLSSALSENEAVSGVLSSFQIEKYIIEMGLPQNVATYLIGPMQRLFAILSSSGIQIFIFLAALKSISPSLYESCYIEGATGWEAFWKITFPMVSPMILVNVVYTIVDSFFSPSNSALKYVQRTIFTNLKFGYGSALAWIYFLVVSIILLLAAGLISRKVFYYDK